VRFPWGDVNADHWGDRAERNQRMATVALALVFYCVAYSMAWFAYGPVIGFAICSPIVGGYLAWLLVHRAEAWLFFPKWLALRDLDGTRHFFNDRPLRIEACDGRCRIAAADVFSVTGQKASDQKLRWLQSRLGSQSFFQDEEGIWWFDEAAVLEWLKGHGPHANRITRRLHRWLEREAFPALHRKIELGRTR